MRSRLTPVPLPMISFRNLALRRGSRTLLSQMDLTIQTGWSLGVIRRNGCGKSTLFAALKRELEPEVGDLDMPSRGRLASVAQETPALPDPAVEYVLGGDEEVAAALKAEADAFAAEDHEAVARAHMRIEEVNGYDARARAGRLMHGLGFAPETHERPVASFSGGWRVRLNLARALMAPSDLLLLDEPTNHLDLDALVWLESWLKRYAGTMIVISHDREFLDAVTNVTVHIERQQLTRYGGNYSAFETLRAEQLELQQAAFSKQKEKIAHLQKFIDRFKAKASKAKQAQSRVKALERMEKVAPLLAEADFSFEFKEPGNIPNPMLSISGASFGYQVEGEAPKTILRGVNRSVLAGQRIGILGANGQGKSTLVKTVAHALAPIAGEISEGKGLNIGYFAQQELDVLRPLDTPMEHMIRLAKDTPAHMRAPGQSGTEQSLRTFLGTFNFSGDMVHQKVGTMSGGEKARLVLCMIVWQRPNLLLLDEPTNHLDLATREALGMALNEFEGTVMLVSHDRSLLRAVCDEFWLVTKGGVEPFDGDLDDYQQFLRDEARRMREQAAGEQKVIAGVSPWQFPFGSG